VSDTTGVRGFESNADGSLDPSFTLAGTDGDRIVDSFNLNAQDRPDPLLLAADGTVKVSLDLAAPQVVASGATAAAIGQFDGQGLRDIQTTPGTFVQQPGVAPGIVGSYMLVADANGDGTDDVFVPGSVVMQRPGGPAGVFTQVESLPSDPTAQLIDLNNDASLDLVRIVGDNLVVRLQTP
jgi:hypothetical protein